ncbi:pyrroline-5-carboxylate reductase [Ancylobacter defluvii]|uniref:Pyrroline-5-carboxylate reductase n=1 Tax=Ancylobacter defluvii TaxID=1282440 RepID=A0A9W6JZ52_9HYPH|nr:pyrroline-5-carboxylate reductase [Ancylobacter defluvii]MBS7588173.1 pyrroline-5-carboxylate reductase [Ancylobacter defluvii]GLK86565.1 pyrroline-5-carboxylate reductase [Ancylobacter defluvii]
MASLSDIPGRVLLVGAGKMGGAMLQGWISLGLEPARIAVVDPGPPPEVAAMLEARGVALNPLNGGVPAVMLLAVKPQVAPDVLARVAPLAGPDTLVVSVMAGRTLAFLEGHFAPGTAVVRSIPNTPAAIGRGVTVAVPNASVSPEQMRIADALLKATGGCEWVEREDLIDVATAVSGSGPAYVFLLAEALAEAGTKAGLPADMADRLARATVAGAGELIVRSGIDPAQLRRNVTSPNGTTAAALAVLMDETKGFGPLLTEAVAAAARRSRELAG